MFQLSCKDKNETNNQINIVSEDNVAEESYIKKYFSTTDIPYLLKEEVDSILVNEEKIKNDKNYRNQFIGKARGRKSAIRKFHFTSYKGKKVPAPFKRFLLPNELEQFNKDSLAQFIILYELYKQRLKKVATIIKYDLLTHDEIQKLIQSSFKDSIHYKELAKKRFLEDSIKFSIKYNRITDSLQSIIHPIDSILPFGPKPLGQLVENNKNFLGFYIKQGDSITEKKKKERKDIYDIWMYFLKLHPYVDADLSEDYEEKLLPPIENYEIVENTLLSTLIQDGYQKEYNPVNGSFVTRLSNINNYELYYTTTGVDYPIGCGAFAKKEEDCCFAKDGYDCNSTGYLILYNREEKFATVIPAYILNNSQSYGFQIQFFYVSNNTIFIYQGYSMYNWFVDKNGMLDRYLHHKDGSTTSARGYKSVGLAKAYEIKILNNNEVKVFKIKK
ncbi:MAG: hypothetical protein CMH15_12620 [Mesonia sp.]|nr:hypothetical protein [Mesonia sp.]MAQ41866.1 hypothetical protein [Mesonia sp.]